MAYNPYGVPGAYPGFPGLHHRPDMSPPGLGPPPGMAGAPGMAPPPGVQHAGSMQAGRVPSTFQPPPNINFSAPVIRLGTLSTGPLTASPTASSTPGAASRTGQGGRHHHGHHHHHQDSPMSAGGGGDRGSGRGADYRGSDRGDRMGGRDALGVSLLAPPTLEDKLRTLFVHKIPDGLCDAAVEKLLGAVGALRRWDPAAPSVLDGSKGTRFGFALFEDAESLATAAELLGGVEVPVRKPAPTPEGPDGKDDTFEGIAKTALRVAIDPNSQKYIDMQRQHRKDRQDRQDAASDGHDSRDRDDDAARRKDAARASLARTVLELFYPRTAAKDGDGDVAMANASSGGIDDSVEVVNIPLAQDDELADIPAEMREVVAAEIAAFRERSNRRDQERIKREEELEEMERQRAARSRPRPGRADSPGPDNVNTIPVKPRGAAAAAAAAASAAPLPSGPKGQHGLLAFVDGSDLSPYLDDGGDDDTDASDDEIYRRRTDKQRADEDKQFAEAERKWANRERTRAAALAREKDRDAQAADHKERARRDQLDRDRAWDDDREASRKTHVYYRDHAAWLRKRIHDRADEDARDEQDRRAQQEDRRREQADLERAKKLADSFLEQQALEMMMADEGRRLSAAAGAAAAAAPAAKPTAPQPQPFKLSLGAAAAQRAQRAGAQRRTIAEVEGLLDDEETAQSSKRALVPIQFEPISGPGSGSGGGGGASRAAATAASAAAAVAAAAAAAAADMTDEEVSAAVRSLASEIPSDKDGLWAWDVQWDFVGGGSVITDKLRPFVEKKIMEYLGVQEEMLVDVVEEHLRKRGRPQDLVEELQEALDDDAQDLVKKLWRMLIFFTECEKRGLPT